MSDTSDTKKPVDLDLLIAGATFAIVLLSASVFLGFFMFLLNVIAVACFVVPIVERVRARPARRPA